MVPRRTHSVASGSWAWTAFLGPLRRSPRDTGVRPFAVIALFAVAGDMPITFGG